MRHEGGKKIAPYPLKQWLFNVDNMLETHILWPLNQCDHYKFTFGEVELKFLWRTYHLVKSGLFFMHGGCE